MYTNVKVFEETPFLSSSIARKLLTCSPQHAWLQHQDRELGRDKHTSSTDFGELAHRLLLNAGKDISIIEADDYRTKDAKAKRQEAYDNNMIPALPVHYNTARVMVERLKEQLPSFGLSALPFIAADNCLYEQQLKCEYQYRPGKFVKICANIDYVDLNNKVIYDYKTTGVSANPEFFSKKIFDDMLDIQAFFHKTCMEIKNRNQYTFRFVVQETFKPYAISIIEINEHSMELSRKKSHHAMDIWNKCLADNYFPAYPTQLFEAVAPSWHETTWSNRLDSPEIYLTQQAG